MVGEWDEHLEAYERAYHGYLQTDALAPAAACAFWIGMRLMFTGELGRGGGWLARAKRALEQHGRECVEEGYMMLPDAYRAKDSGDLEAAVTTAASAAEVGRRFDDPNLFALATHAEGLCLIEAGRLGSGLALAGRSPVAR